MDLDPRGYEGETDLDKIKAQQKLSEIRSVRRSTGAVLLLLAGLLLLAVYLLGSRRGSIMSQYGYPSPKAADR